jgi:dTDP-4-amino-4,6-dideoxygalactose transaminase
LKIQYAKPKKEIDQAIKAKLKYLDVWNKKRRAAANTYRDGLLIYLEERGVSCGIHYPLQIHFQKAFKSKKNKPGSFPNAENAADKILSLPMFPEITKEQIEYVVDMIDKYPKL